MLKTVTIFDPPPSQTPLKALADFDAEKRARWDQLNAYQPNGIACPSCGQECAETAIGPPTHTKPPKWPIRCLSCAWVGHRVAC